MLVCEFIWHLQTSLCCLVFFKILSGSCESLILCLYIYVHPLEERSALDTQAKAQEEEIIYKQYFIYTFSLADKLFQMSHFSTSFVYLTCFLERKKIIDKLPLIQNKNKENNTIFPLQKEKKTSSLRFKVFFLFRKYKLQFA